MIFQANKVIFGGFLFDLPGKTKVIPQARKCELPGKSQIENPCFLRFFRLLLSYIYYLRKDYNFLYLKGGVNG